MSAEESNAVEFEGPLVQEQYGIEAGARPSGNRLDEDVRRFACDRCRGQKLRCERNRLSLHTPLKSTPCRRCIKTRVRCITSSQARIGRNLDEPGTRTQRRQTTKQNRGPTYDVQLGEYAGGSDDDGAEEGPDREAEMQDSLDRQPRASNNIVNPIDGTIQSPSKIAGTGTTKFGPPRVQDLDGNARSVVDLSILHDAQSVPLYPKPMTPNKAKPMVAQNRVQISPQPIQYTFDDFPSHLGSPGGNAPFFEDTNSIMEHNFDSTEGVNWSDTSLMGTTNVSLDQENELAAGNLDSHQDISQYGSSGGGSAAFNNNGRLAASVNAFGTTGGTDFLTQSSTLQREHIHVELTGKLTQLTTALLNELDSDQADSLLTTQRADNPENQNSPMSKLLWNVERFLGILGDISIEKNMRCPSIKDPFDSVLNSLGVDDHDFEGRAQPAKKKNRSASSATQLPSCGLPGLTTMMAIFATYSCVLQAYERVFDKIHRSLLHAGRSDRLSLSLLPLFQLDSVKFATQNSLQVHIAMEVSLQMLNQIENRLACIISAYGSNREETKACLLALLQSLTYNEGGDSLSASAMIRDTINGVRKLFIS